MIVVRREKERGKEKGGEREKEMGRNSDEVVGDEGREGRESGERGSRWTGSLCHC